MKRIVEIIAILAIFLISSSVKAQLLDPVKVAKANDGIVEIKYKNPKDWRYYDNEHSITYKGTYQIKYLDGIEREEIKLNRYGKEEYVLNNGIIYEYIFQVHNGFVTIQRLSNGNIHYVRTISGMPNEYIDENDSTLNESQKTILAAAKNKFKAAEEKAKEYRELMIDEIIYYLHSCDLTYEDDHVYVYDKEDKESEQKYFLSIFQNETTKESLVFSRILEEKKQKELAIKLKELE